MPPTPSRGRRERSSRPVKPSPTTSEDPLEEMEEFANFPTDPALEWLITKRREELGNTDALNGDVKGKGKAKLALPADLDADEECTLGSSYREYFKACYITSTCLFLLRMRGLVC